LFWEYFEKCSGKISRLFRNILSCFSNMSRLFCFLKYSETFSLFRNIPECSGIFQNKFWKYFKTKFGTFQECSGNIKMFVNSVLELLFTPRTFRFFLETLQNVLEKFQDYSKKMQEKCSETFQECSETLRRFSKVFQIIPNSFEIFWNIKIWFGFGKHSRVFRNIKTIFRNVSKH